MSAGGFAMALALIAIVIIVAMYFTIRWVNRPIGDEPTERGDAEP